MSENPIIDPEARESADSGATQPTTVKDILADVGDDKAKAQAYLDEENAAERPRTSLVEKLQAVLGAELAAATPEGVKLVRGEETVTAYKPATITQLKSEGWKVAE
jgi:hypothetical protein